MKNIGFPKNKKFKYRHNQAKRIRRPWLTLGVLVLVAFAGVWALRHWYYNNLRPISADTTAIYFTVSSGESKTQIAQELQNVKLIRSAQALETYLRGNEIQTLQAGTYRFSQSMSAQQIVRAMAKGEVAKNLLTILPGKRLDQIKQAFSKAGYSQSEIDTAFNPATYAGDPAIISLPHGATLEGYLYPDSFQKEADTPASAIVKESLDEMQTKLTDDIVGGFGAHGLNVFQGITLASIVVQESSKASDQPTVAQVFLSRLQQGMTLGSDVTAFYASVLAGRSPTVTIDSPYNTRIYTGLPPGPIGNVTASALQAVAHPSATDYLYFVAGDDGVVHFSHTAAEHQQAIQQYCSKACSQ